MALFGTRPLRSLVSHPGFAEGVRAIAGPALGTVALGLVTGVAMARSGLPMGAVLAMSLLVFASASQLACLPMILADLYHMLEEGEDVSVVREAGSRLAHVHVAAPGTRTLPMATTDGTVMAAFFRELGALGYDRRVSIECQWEDVAALGESVAFLRATWQTTA